MCRRSNCSGWPGGGCGHGKQSSIDCDKLYCKHCTSEICWDLVGINRSACAAPTDSERNSNLSEQEKNIVKDGLQNWKDEVMVIRQRLLVQKLMKT